MRSENTPAEGLVAGRNPVLELLKSGQPVDKIYLVKTDGPAGSAGKIAAIAREAGIPIKDVTREKLDSICCGVLHQGVAAITAGCTYCELEDLLEVAKQKEEPLFVVLCDDIEDPHNLGAIIRSAEAAGAHGVIVPKRHGVGVTPTVLRASAGAAAHLPIARVPNLAAAVDELKKQGVWVYAADLGGDSWCTVDYAGPVVFIIGSEGKGVSRLLREKSDFVVTLPMLGKVSSLNASVAGGIVMYEIARQRLQLNAKNQR